jgi:hypothetical protein
MPEDNEMRRLFTSIGCIMEDAALIALLRKTSDKLSATERMDHLTTANKQISALLKDLGHHLGNSSES